MLADNLADLLDVYRADVEGLLSHLEGCENSAADLVDIDFYYVRLQDGRCRQRALVKKLHECIVPYCLVREPGMPTRTQVAAMYLKARNLLQTKTAKTAKTGEAGELLAYFLIEGCLGAPKILTKMSLKTNREMPIHGSDGVHLAIMQDGRMCLYFAEAKLYSRWDQAIGSAIQSVKDFLGDDREADSALELEVNLVQNYLDVPKGPLRKAILDVLNPYSKARDGLLIYHACVIGFDYDVLNDRINQEDLEERYRTTANHIVQYITKKIEKDELLREQRWVVIFVPFWTVQDFRAHFLRLVRGEDDESL